jgi:ABC-type transporter Mla MlaB component
MGWGLAVPEQNPKARVTTVEVSVTGPVTRDEAVRWRDAFSDGLARGPGLRIDLADSGPWDVAGVQLLLAAIASGRRLGRPVVLAGVPGVLRGVAERAGVLEPLAAVAEGSLP